MNDGNMMEIISDLTINNWIPHSVCNYQKLRIAMNHGFGFVVTIYCGKKKIKNIGNLGGPYFHINYMLVGDWFNYVKPSVGQVI
jgi:hypothetical protein